MFFLDKDKFAFNFLDECLVMNFFVFYDVQNLHYFLGHLRVESFFNMSDNFPSWGGHPMDGKSLVGVVVFGKPFSGVVALVLYVFLFCVDESFLNIICCLPVMLVGWTDV